MDKKDGPNIPNMPPKAHKAEKQTRNKVKKRLTRKKANKERGNRTHRKGGPDKEARYGVAKKYITRRVVREKEEEE